MENHSLVDGAVQMAGNAANSVGRKIAPAVRFMATTFSSPSSAALLSLANAATLSVATALSSPAGATEMPPTASAVAAIKVEVTKATLQGLKIDPDSLADFDKLSAASQGKVLFFLDGLKKAQKFPDTAAEKLPSLKEAAEKLIFLFNNQKINEASRQAMSKMDGTLGKVRNVERLISQLSDPKTYGIILASPDSAYGQRFSQEKQAMMATYTEAEMLQAKAEKMDSPKLTAAKKRETESEAALAASRNELAASRDRLATSRATLQTLQQINQSFAGK